MRFYPLFLSIGFSVLLFAACNAQSVPAQKSSLSVSEAHTWVESGALLVDVREPEEVATLTYGVKNYRNIPLSELESRVDEIPRDRPVVLACRSGNRSRKAYEWLASRGFKNIANMEGGLLAWQAEGLPVVRPR